MREPILIGLGFTAGSIIAETTTSTTGQFVGAILAGITIAVLVIAFDTLHDHYSFKTDIRG
jgi:hypothetical protein